MVIQMLKMMKEVNKLKELEHTLQIFDKTTKSPTDYLK